MFTNINQGFGVFQDTDEMSWMLQIKEVHAVKKTFGYDANTRMIECRSSDGQTLGQFDVDGLRGWIR